ncbi:hypothetical protein C0Q70_08232 [Pomacea canaliculata]|uniref:Uncharacterized protein n=1 Tax=Pomacea canaliculata TaxID=400727 RepID=A0A2T7PH90_POMCA|nr:hypothetical protein C0Q70_08232 [Pomacea canaliculata]
MSARQSSSEADSPSAHVQSSTAKTGKQSTGGSPPNTRQGGQATPQRQPSLGGNSTQSRPATRREDAELSPRNSLKETGPAISRHSSSRIKNRASDGVDPASETTSAAESKRGLDDVEKLSQAARSRSSTHREKDRIKDKHSNPEVNEEKDKEDEKSASDAAFNSDVLGIERYSSCSRVDAAGARAVLDFGPEVCSCFPSRSSHTVPSMLYDQVHCLHCHVTGHAHVGVFHFDDNWDANVRNVKSTDRHPPTKKYISGYPYFQLSEFQEDDHSAGKEKSHNTTTERSRAGQRATDECYIFDITPDFGRRLDQWNARKELTRQRTRDTKKTKGDNY